MVGACLSRRCSSSLVRTTTLPIELRVFSVRNGHVTFIKYNISQDHFLGGGYEMGDKAEATSVGINRKADGQGDCLSAQVASMMADFKALHGGGAGRTNTGEHHLPACSFFDSKAGVDDKAHPKVAAAAEAVTPGTPKPADGVQTTAGAADYASVDKTQEAAKRMGLNVTSGFDQFDRMPIPSPEPGSGLKPAGAGKGTELSAADVAPILDQRPAPSAQELAKSQAAATAADVAPMLDQRPAPSAQELARSKAASTAAADAAPMLDQRPALSDHDLVTTFARGQDFLAGKNTTVSGADASKAFPSSQSLEKQLRTEVQEGEPKSGNAAAVKKYDAGVLEKIHQIASYSPEDLKHIGDINNTLLDPNQNNLDQAMHTTLKGIDADTLKRLEPGMELDMHKRLGDTSTGFYAFYKGNTVGLQVRNGSDIETYHGDGPLTK